MAMEQQESKEEENYKNKIRKSARTREKEKVKKSGDVQTI